MGDKFVIFDVDGTLNQTALYAVEAYQKAMKKRGRELAEEEVLSLIGLSPRVIIERLFGTLSEEKLKAWRADIKNYEFEIMEERASAFEGMEETLIELKRLGYGLAICSNAFTQHIEHVLNAIGLIKYFDVIGSLEMGNNKTEVLSNLLKKIAPAKACMVGDRIFDIDAARNNKIPVLGCAYGYAPEEIKNADAIIHNPSEILKVIDKIL